FPNDVIEGNMNTAIIQCGTPTEVYDEARQVIERGKNLPNGFILRPACELPPLAPPENMHAITRALNDFGWY
ncbi:MAG: uroporphyrinogen-III decarboxylase, partial [Chloroflexi bacterium]|nr:uroporphyrinogen-III decarboxylase [Chloroflexota bacterium]